MADYDSHIALYDVRSIEAVRVELRNDYTEVVGSTQLKYPKAIFTVEAQSSDEARENHERLCSLARRLGTPVLVETEKDFDLDMAVGGEWRGLVNEWRMASRLHWGDIHVDIPVNYETRALRQRFEGLGYHHIITVKANRPTPHAIMTAQFEDKDLLVPIFGQARKAAKELGFELANCKGERLLYFDTFGGAEPLPITVALREF